MNYDIDVLQEALDLNVASTQMELAQMGYNDAVEIEANKTRELHELKPASWFAQTFNTDGEVKRREEAVKISTALTSAKERKETFLVWRTALSPAHEQFKKGPYKKIIAELKKAYPEISSNGGQTIRQQAVTGELGERNALLWAYSGRATQTQFKQLQHQGVATACALAINADKINTLSKPSLFAQIFNTPAQKAYVQQRNELMNEKKFLVEHYERIKKEREPLRQNAIEYAKYGPALIMELESKHPDMKKKQEALEQSPNTAAALNSSPSRPLITPATPTRKKTPQEIWGIKTTIPHSLKQDHPFSVPNPDQPPTPKKLHE